MIDWLLLGVQFMDKLKLNKKAMKTGQVPVNEVMYFAYVTFLSLNLGSFRILCCMYEFE